MSMNRSGRWSDLGLRFISAAILGPIALLALWYGKAAWLALIMVCLFGLGAEWAKLSSLPGLALRSLMLPVGLVAVALVSIFEGYLPGFFVLLGLTALAWRLNGRFAAMGLPYAGLGGLSLLWLRLQPGYGLHDTLFLVVVVWGTDIGAYLVGRIVGGPKLAPRISPGKTLSGSVGGLIIGGLCGVLLDSSMAGLHWWALLPGCALSLFAQIGDLAESAVKRHLGVKDSGRTIPGHGGLFDRLDGFLAASPVAALVAACLHGGLALWP